MAQTDRYIQECCCKVVLAGTANDIETIWYRQSALQDCLNNPVVLRELYALTVKATESGKKHYLGSLTCYPHWVLRDAIDQMEASVEFLKNLRELADRNIHKFTSEAWKELFAMLTRELDDAYIASIRETCERLHFHGATLLSAQLGDGNKPTRYVLHQPLRRTWKSRWSWLWEWIFPPKAPPNSFSIHPRDEAGISALQRLHDQGIGFTANAMAQSKDHVRNFFNTLRAELAFYVGCVNLHEVLAAKGEPVCTPSPQPPELQCLSFRGLYDIGLSLSVRGRVVGNDADADRKGLIIVTGANQGGKSTFLRSVGLAQLMMQSGMFVPAGSFRASICRSLCTHFKREEDAGMTSGKFDEELSRMSDIVDHIAPYSMVLFNESFAATNEREGSEVATQVMTALLEKSFRVVCVTHLYELAHGFFTRKRADILFLRADRHPSGERSFKLVEGEPLPSSFGLDLYEKIFTTSAGDRGVMPAATSPARLVEGSVK
jgi:DNA mismatch repair ATPase MutS